MAISDEVLYLTVRELGDRIRARQLSPVELTQAYLLRCKKYGHQLNAFAMLMPDLALQQAHEAEEEIHGGHYRGPMHGIPYAAKDLLAVAGYPTTWGTRPYQTQVFHHDATVIRQLRDAGAILLGKAAMIELGWRIGLSLRSRVGHRGGQESVEHELLDLRLVQRLGRNRRSRTGGLRDWHRDMGLYRLSVSFLRGLGIAAHFRTGWTRRRHGAVLLDGQDWSHVPHSG